jgi:hypothetical protein
MKEINDINQYAGRGRPRVENPLSQADRARAYRERKKAGQLVKRDDNKTVTKNLETLPAYGMLESRIILLNAENMALSDQLQAALDIIAALKAELISVTSHKKPKPKK